MFVVAEALNCYHPQLDGFGHPVIRSLTVSGASVASTNNTDEILVTWPDYAVDDPSTGGALRTAGLHVRLHPRTSDRSPDEVAVLVDGAVGAIVSTDPFPASVIEASPRLRVIARVGVGVDSIDVEAATRRGVAVTITPGANEASVADHTLALMLAVLRRVSELDQGVRRGEWCRTGKCLAGTLTGTTVGLVGYGRIGRLVARRLSGFGVRLLVCDPAVAPEPEVEVVDLQELLRVSDVVSLHAPLLPSTHHLISDEQFAQMRPGAVLINTARGGIVDEQALIRALALGGLKGAGLDVFEHEPPVGSPLLAMPNVVLSPHNAALNAVSTAQMTTMATNSVLDVLSGRRPDHLVNPDAVGDLAVEGVQR